MGYKVEELKPGYIGRFVIHDHKASHHHWDLRLSFPVESIDEALGTYREKRPPGRSPEPQESKSNSGLVLRSWAIPKHKVPTNKSVLAIETENHAYAYKDFEGTIPEGEYGAGDVTIYDEGSYKLLDVDYDQKYIVKFNGKKIKGVYALIKTHGKQFLWTKVKDTSKYKLSALIRECAHIIKRASVIDYIRPTMHPGIWDIGTPTRLKSNIRQHILKLLFKSVDRSWVTNVFIVGSAASYNYKEDGDLDIDVLCRSDIPDDKRHDLQRILRKNKNVKIPGTDLTYSFLVYPEKDFPRCDGIYDVLNDKWIKIPPRIPENFDPDKAFIRQKLEALRIMRGIYGTISDIIAILRDLEKIDQYNQHYDNKLAIKRQAVKIILKKLCEKLSNWRRTVWKKQELPDPVNAKYPAYDFSLDWNEDNVIFKYIARYGGHEPVYYLYNLLEGSPYLDLIKSLMPAGSIGDVLISDEESNGG